MAAPTETEIRNQIGDQVKILDETYKFCNSNATNFLGLYDAAFARPLEGDWSAEVAAGMDSFRAALSDVFRRGRAMIDPLLLAYGKLLGFPDDTPEGVLARLYVEFAERGTPQQLQERNFTFGTPAASGSPAGDGTIHRLNIDRYSYEIEAQFADTKWARCVADEHSGADEHEELFEFRGGNRSRDSIVIEGSGAGRTIKALSARDSEQFLRNPSFAEFDGTTSVPTSIAGWTPNTSIGNFEIVQGAGNYYRDYPGEGTPASLKIKANDKVVQNFNERSALFNPLVPYYCQLAWNREVGTGDGTITLRFGNVSANVVLAAQTGWNILRIAVGANNWFRQFNKENPGVEVELSGRTTGYVLVDDIVLSPYSNFDGSWYAVVGGATPFLRDDRFTWTDSIPSDAKVQKWLHWLYGAYLPADATPTWSDP